MTVLANSFEGITPSGTAVSAANSGGLSGNAFDSVSIGTGATVASDSAHAAHGTLGCQIATTGTSAAALAIWSTSMGTQTTIWYRAYCYFTANPAATSRIFRAAQGATLCSGVAVTTAGKIQTFDSANVQITLSTATIPLNQWFRLEGFITGSATVGQAEAKLFKTADSTAPDDVQTSTATFNTLGAPDTYSFGVPTTTSVIGPFWLDDVAISSTGYTGPAVTAAALPQQPGKWLRRSRRPAWQTLQPGNRPDVYPAGGFSVATASLTDTFRPAQATGPGDLLVLFLGSAGSNAINATSVTDTKGNKWVRGPFVAASGTLLPTSSWIAANTVALTTGDTLTVTWDTASSFAKNGCLTGINAQIVPNPGADLTASATATGSSNAASVTSGVPNYAGAFAVGVINTGFAGAVINLTGANTSAGLVQHNDATDWMQPAWQPVQGGGAMSLTSSNGVAAWTAIIVVVAPNAQIAPVYPLQRPVTGRVPLRPRTAAGWCASRAGPFQGTGPPVKPLPGPVKGQPGVPFLKGRAQSRRGPYGQLGPPARIWHAPAKGQPGVPFLTGRARGRAGPFQGTGPPVKPLPGPVKGQPAFPYRCGRSAARTGPYGQLGPPARIWHAPVTGRRPPPAPRTGAGSGTGRAGPPGVLGPPLRPLRGPVRGTTTAPPRRGRISQFTFRAPAVIIFIPGCATITNTPAGAAALANAAPAAALASAQATQAVTTSTAAAAVVVQKVMGAATITSQACPGTAPAVTLPAGAGGYPVNYQPTYNDPD